MQSFYMFQTEEKSPWSIYFFEKITCTWVLPILDFIFRNYFGFDLICKHVFEQEMWEGGGCCVPLPCDHNRTAGVDDGLPALEYKSSSHFPLHRRKWAFVGAPGCHSNSSPERARRVLAIGMIAVVACCSGGRRCIRAVVAVTGRR